MPESTPEVESVIPSGSFPELILKIGEGKPLAIELNELMEPTLKVALSVDVMEGAWFTVRVKAWVASVPTPLDALIVIA